MQDKTFCHFCGSRLTRKWWEGHHRLFCTSCDVPIYENPIPATCLVVVDGGGRLLLVRRSTDPKKGCWCLPGGFMELGESPEQAALRELTEETGLAGKIGALIGVTSAAGELYHTILMIAYAVKDYTGEVRPGDDAAAAEWFARDELPEIAFDSHRRMLAAYWNRLQP